MFPGFETLLGGLLGGALRLGQAVIDAREKQRDRDHEFRMTELQGLLAEKANEARMRELGLHATMALDAQDAQLLVAGIQSQTAEAAAAGGRVAALSATVRPLVTYLFVGIYIAWMAAQIMAAWETGGLTEALRSAYGEPDRAILSTILTFWFADRSLRRGRSPLAA